MRSPPLSHIYIWSGWMDKLNAPRVEARGHPHPLPELFLRITHISETILSILTKVMFIMSGVQSIIHAWLVYSLVSYLFIKQDQMILTCNSAVASLMLSRFLIIIFCIFIYIYIYVYILILKTCKSIPSKDVFIIISIFLISTRMVMFNDNNFVLIGNPK